MNYAACLMIVVAALGTSGATPEPTFPATTSVEITAEQELKPGYFKARLAGEASNRNMQSALFQTTYSGRVHWHGGKPGRARLVMDGKGRDADIILELRSPIVGEVALTPGGHFTHGRTRGEVKAMARQGRMRFESKRGEIMFEPAGEGLVRASFYFVMERPGRYNNSYVLSGELLMEDTGGA